MAIREEYDFVSENERKFLFDSIHDKPHIRADGRELMQQRKIRVQFRRMDDQSQAEVQLGRTRVIANVHGEIVPPFPDRPTEGFLHFSVELSPMASQNFEVGRPSPLAVELARIVDRGIRECRALDTEALAIVAGEKVWSITCNIHVVDHGGNLIDCVSLAAIAAMMHFRRPEVSVQGNATTVYRIDDHAAVPLSLHHIPISISFCFIQNKESDSAEPIIFMDPTDREERITDGSMTFTFNSFRELCAVHKIGGAAISTTEVLRCANIAAARVAELTDFLKEEADKADKEAIERRRTMLRGRDFADVSSLAETVRQAREEVDLGQMTDFNTLHAPIALRDDPTQEEDNAKVSSMAQLMESLEQAASITDTPAPSSGGLSLSADARAEFQKLTAGLSIRELVAGASEAKPKAGAKKAKKPVADSDSEEESVVVQSEFNGAKASTPVAEEPKKKPAPAKKTKRTAKKAAVSDDSDDEVDLSAAIKRKPRK
ncbi:hypothetical protein Poli38472_011702 [Pythium oligandrum]|uniref:Exosome complex component RRP45 n=1 Tax=Pythium oligandrum TaxID=41045 RepID=A0A8K1C7Y8_PYTOL|nr:hypothetical protein Poli38472_011702 [Pythium oligandrum]|eukprot:TMW58114.1 hypothetical protein Poli38472_011702 [Pythium oligandrum]